MSRTKEGTPRNQQQLYSSLDYFITEDNPVRLIDLLVDKVVASDPNFLDFGDIKTTGRKRYSPVLLLKILLYSYLNSIRSVRDIEKELNRNIELMWLSCRLVPSYKTINTFRTKYQDKIASLTLSFTKFIVNEGYGSTSVVAIDGSKIKANASLEVKSQKSLKKQLTRLQGKLDILMQRIILDSVNLHAITSDANFITLNEITILCSKIDQLQIELQNLVDSNLKMVIPNDPDAKLMKTRDGIKPAYNAQSIVETQNHFILSATIKTQENDINQLKEEIENFEDALGVRPEIVLADTGYANMKDIYELETAPGKKKVKCIVAMPNKAAKKKDKKAGITFTFDKENNQYKCSQGKTLKLIHSRKKKGNDFFHIYQCKECSGCKRAIDCTNSKNGRSIQRSVNAHWNEEFEKRMKRKAYKAFLKVRKEVVEHPFGTIKWVMGKLGFLLTSKTKVQVELDLLVMAYNIKRLVNIEPVKILLSKVNSYDWETGFSSLYCDPE